MENVLMEEKLVVDAEKMSVSILKKAEAFSTSYFIPDYLLISENEAANKRIRLEVSEYASRFF